MGVIAYTLLIGKPPFETNDVKLTYNRIKTCSYSFPDTIALSEQAKNFIAKLLQLDPSRRPTVPEILNDPFLVSESVPASLPISSLACPPSLDFLKKYRDLELDEGNLNKSSKKNEHFSSSTLYQTTKLESAEDKKIEVSSKMNKSGRISAMSKQKSFKNLNTRVQST